MLTQCQTVHSFCSVIVKVKEHEEFFPAFHSLVTQLMLTLGKLHTIAQNIPRIILSVFFDVSLKLLFFFILFSEVDCLNGILPALTSLKLKSE